LSAEKTGDYPELWRVLFGSTRKNAGGWRVAVAGQEFKAPDTSAFGAPTAGVIGDLPPEATEGRVCFSSERSLRGTNSSASPSALQRRAPSEFGGSAAILKSVVTCPREGKRPTRRRIPARQFICGTSSR
jgi:hypothetical protein